MNISELKGDPQNPRIINKKEFESLKNSIKEFGDLSGIVLNETTNELVGGHQRVQAFKALRNNAMIEIAQRLDTPTPKGTVAIGFVTMDGERYSYRVVQWDKPRQQAANIAANRIQGQFDLELLAEVNYMLEQENPDLLRLTGQTEEEINKLLNMVSGEPEIALADGDKPGFQQVTFTLSDEQAEIVDQAMRHVKATTTFENTGNENSNGNALYYIAQSYVNHKQDAAE